MKEMKKYVGNLFGMLRCLFSMGPQLFFQITVAVIIDAALPYVDVVAIQLLIDELLVSKKSEKIKYIIIITIASNVLLQLTSNSFKKKREVSQVRLEMAFQEKMKAHEMRLSTTDIESNRVQELKRNIEQAKMRNGGIENLIYDFEAVVSSVVTIILTFFAFIYVFSGQKKGEESSFWTSPFPMIILVAIILASSLITLKKQSKQNIMVSDLNNQVNQANGSAFAYMQFISNYHFGKEIRIFDLGDYLCNFFENLWTSSIGYKLMQKLGKEKAKIPCVTILCNEVLNIFIYVLAIGKAYAKELTAGSIVVYLKSIQSFVNSMVSLIGMSGEIITHGVLIQPFLEIMATKEEILIKEDASEMPNDVSEITFEHVYFKYPEQEEWVLEDVSFTIKSNQKMALVGENGSGKSTLIKLLCRLYEPSSGSIKFNGVDISNYNKTDYWNMLSVVFQDFSLPALSLGNVISGKEDYAKEEELTILQKLGINKPHLSLDRFIYNDFSDNGVEISGGEGQKIAIARAIYKKAPIIILDEPTASLDPISEADIYRDFNRLSEGRTCVFISHRLQSCRVCDFVLVLHKGKVAEQGTHEELVEQNGKYKELWVSQISLYEDSCSV